MRRCLVSFLVLPALLLGVIPARALEPEALVEMEATDDLSMQQRLRQQGRPTNFSKNLIEDHRREFAPPLAVEIWEYGQAKPAWIYVEGKPHGSVMLSLDDRSSCRATIFDPQKLQLGMTVRELEVALDRPLVPAPVPDDSRASYAIVQLENLLLGLENGRAVYIDTCPEMAAN